MTDRDAKVLDLYGSGMLLKDIAALIGVSPNYVGMILKKLGVERPSKPQHKKKNYEPDDVVARWDEGLSVSAISERYSIGVALVRRILVAAGRDIVTARRHRYDGRAGNARRSGNAFARIARRT